MTYLSALSALWHTQPSLRGHLWDAAGRRCLALQARGRWSEARELHRALWALAGEPRTEVPGDA